MTFTQSVKVLLHLEKLSAQMSDLDKKVTALESNVQKLNNSQSSQSGQLLDVLTAVAQMKQSFNENVSPTRPDHIAPQQQSALSAPAAISSTPIPIQQYQQQQYQQQSQSPAFHATSPPLSPPAFPGSIMYPSFDNRNRQYEEDERLAHELQKQIEKDEPGLATSPVGSPQIDGEKCPVCAVFVPTPNINDHVNSHFDDKPAVAAAAAAAAAAGGAEKQQEKTGFWSRLFKKNEQDERKPDDNIVPPTYVTAPVNARPPNMVVRPGPMPAAAAPPPGMVYKQPGQLVPASSIPQIYYSNGQAYMYRPTNYMPPQGQYAMPPNAVYMQPAAVPDPNYMK